MRNRGKVLTKFCFCCSKSLPLYSIVGSLQNIPKDSLWLLESQITSLKNLDFLYPSPPILQMGDQASSVSCTLSKALNWARHQLYSLYFHSSLLTGSQGKSQEHNWGRLASPAQVFHVILRLCYAGFPVADFRNFALRHFLKSYLFLPSSLTPYSFVEKCQFLFFCFCIYKILDKHWVYTNTNNTIQRNHLVHFVVVSLPLSLCSL